MVALPEPRFTPLGGSLGDVNRDATSFPLALIRDPASGEVLSFARDGSVGLAAPGAVIAVILSDGLGSSAPPRQSVR